MKNNLKYIYPILLLLSLSSNSSFSQSSWEVFEETTIESKINGSIKKGFIFKTASYNIYEVIEYVYLYEYLYSPEVIVLKSGDIYKLYIDGIEETLLCKKLNNGSKNMSQGNEVIESQIDGDFEGFEGETIIKLMNGQVWQQSEYYYHYYYHFMPKVIIYKSGSSYKIKVEGIDKSVGVVKLN